MANKDVFDALEYMTESLSPDIKKRATHRSPMLSVVPVGEFQLFQGLEKTTYEGMPTESDIDDEAWVASVTSDGNNNSGQGGCARTYKDVEVGFKTGKYRPYIYGLRGPTLCTHDFKFSFNSAAFIAWYMAQLSKRTKRTNELRYNSLYMQIARKFVVTGTGEGSVAEYSELALPYASHTGAVPNGALDGLNTITAMSAATGGLTQEILNGLALDMIDIGATEPDSGGFISVGGAGPLLSLAIHPSETEQLVKSNAGLREDARYATPGTLLQRMGATTVLRNWRHVPDMRPDRFHYNFTVTGASIATTTSITAPAGTFSNASVGQTVFANGGTGSIAAGTTIIAVASDGSSITLSAAGTTGSPTTIAIGPSNAANYAAASAVAGRYSRVNTYINVVITAGKGKEPQVNPVWRKARFETAKVLTPYVFTAEYTRPVSQIGNMNWNPMSSMGEWRWVRGMWRIDPTYTSPDPDEAFGCHFASFEFAPRPDFPKYGFTIWYKRSNAPLV